MKIACVGGGPAGLFFALLIKKHFPDFEVIVFERNRPDDTYGWGVVFSDQTLGNLADADFPTYTRIKESFRHWDEIEVRFRGRVIRSGGHGFAGISRVKLLKILQDRCSSLGVRLLFGRKVEDDEALVREHGFDLVVASDGINSRIREKYRESFRPSIELGRNRYVWLGVKKSFPAFTFIFEETPWGWYQAHVYQFDEDTATFIVETTEEAWSKSGLESMNQEESIRFCEELFAAHLDGARLLSNARHLRGSATWIRFPRVLCERWVRWNGEIPVVLMGDAAHTAHFSIGSGTKLAMEDAIELANAFVQAEGETTRLREILEGYQQARQLAVLRLQKAARNSADWFENVRRYAHLEPEQFAYSLITRSQRLFHSDLALRDQRYVREYEGWLAERSGLGRKPIPPMFLPFRVRDVILKNRIVVAPMAMYSAQDGEVNDFHLVHLGARALGGASLVFTEMTAPSPEGRISPGCAGLYSEAHMRAYKRIVDFIHRYTDAKVALQLGHSGPKGSTQVGWEQIHEPLPEGNWEIIAPSPVPWGPNSQVPREMTKEDMERVKQSFVQAALWAIEAGFDWLELHCAHGYLLAAFISPLTNRRTDEYGGDLDSRLRFPLEVFRALRAVWPAHLPMSVRISAHDWAPGGITPDDAVEVAKRFKEAGCDVISVSSGQTVRYAKPVFGRMFNLPFSDRIRNEVGIPTIVAGNIFDADHVNTIVASGRADLCALARPHLVDVAWTLKESIRLGYLEATWPRQYLEGKRQAVRLLKAAKERSEDLMRKEDLIQSV